MQQLSRIFTPVCLAALMVLLGNLSLATTKTSLKSINQKITKLQHHLLVYQNRLQKLQNELRDIEVKSSNSTIKLKTIQRRLNNKKLLLTQLQGKQQSYQQQLQNQQAVLAKQIRAAYLFGRVPYLKLLLNQKNTAKISRVLTYYRYICQTRANTIKKIKKILSSLENNKKHQQQAITTLANMNNELQHTYNQLHFLRSNRTYLLTKIKRKITTQQQRLAILATNKKQLEKTIQQVEYQSQQTLHYNFAKLRGKLNWPTHGRIITTFNQVINHSQLRATGIIIKAKMNQPVKAVASGKIIFSKWLSGYGLLLIISHGHGFMTIYGRNHVLYKKAGDIVQKGDVIATVGQSGGFRQPSLYFAIRHNAKALNPSRWIR